MVIDVGCVCCACWWQCEAGRNCSAWFVLVNVGFVERSAFLIGVVFLRFGLVIV